VFFRSDFVINCEKRIYLTSSALFYQPPVNRLRHTVLSPVAVMFQRRKGSHRQPPHHRCHRVAYPRIRGSQDLLALIFFYRVSPPNSFLTRVFLRIRGPIRLEVVDYLNRSSDSSLSTATTEAAKKKSDLRLFPKFRLPESQLCHSFVVTVPT